MMRSSKFFDKKRLLRSLRPEVVEAAEVIEVAKVLRPGKSLLMTSKSSLFLNSALF